ncbi:hypothetical protein P4O66_004587 [Electrophorus voltai]|uniref:Uncharacterized protein n=1 Tax=Electrophorus voltai TaxID=2609070 RepID=A0AAD9E241_9TELE|nr:hypothetical protein P4O66_004587 [Electrophorus voltai]
MPCSPFRFGKPKKIWKQDGGEPRISSVLEAPLYQTHLPHTGPAFLKMRGWGTTGELTRVYRDEIGMIATAKSVICLSEVTVETLN